MARKAYYLQKQDGLLHPKYQWSLLPGHLTSKLELHMNLQLQIPRCRR